MCVPRTRLRRSPRMMLTKPGLGMRLQARYSDSVRWVYARNGGCSDRTRCDLRRKAASRRLCGDPSARVRKVHSRAEERGTRHVKGKLGWGLGRRNKGAGGSGPMGARVYARRGGSGKPRGRDRAGGEFPSPPPHSPPPPAAACVQRSGCDCV